MKRFLILMALAASLLLSGCARGEITVELSRLGAADLTAKLVTLPILQPTAETFEEDFKKDGYTVQKVDEGEYKGFVAHRHYNQLSDIKESKLLRTYDFETWSHAAQYAVKNNGAARR